MNSDIALVRNVHSQNVGRKIRIRCRPWIIRAGNDFVWPVIRLVVRLGGIMGDVGLVVHSSCNI